MKENIHDIGENTIVTLLKNAGFRIIDTGIDVLAEQFVEKLKETRAVALGLSCLLNIAYEEMRNGVDTLTRSGIRD